MIAALRTRGVVCAVVCAVVCGLAGLSLAACGGSGSVPVPMLGPTALPPTEPAVIALPITIAVTALRAQLEQAIPRADSLDQAQCSALGGIVCHQYVFRRDTLELHPLGDRIDVVARLRYRGRLALPAFGSVGSCGYAPDAMPRAELRFGTTLYWRTDWRLGSRNTTGGATLPDRCAVTLLRVDATPLMRRIVNAQVASLVQQADSAFPAVANLRPVADSLWRAMQEPIALDSAGSLWLVFSPEAIGVAPIDSRAGGIHTGLTMYAHPRVVSGARPVIVKRALPALTVARPGEGIHVPVQIELPFVEVGRRSTELLAAETRGQPLRVEKVTVSGAADTAVVRLTLSGRMNGDLLLVGRPRYDVAARTLLFDDLHYTIDSRDRLTRLKATLGAPLVKHAIDAATDGGRLAIGPQLDSMRLAMTQQMNRPLAPDVAVGGGVTALRVTGLYTTADAFVIRVVLDGSAGIWMR